MKFEMFWLPVKLKVHSPSFQNLVFFIWKQHFLAEKFDMGYQKIWTFLWYQNLQKFKKKKKNMTNPTGLLNGTKCKKYKPLSLAHKHVKVALWGILEFCILWNTSKFPYFVHDLWSANIRFDSVNCMWIWNHVSIASPMLPSFQMCLFSKWTKCT